MANMKKLFSELQIETSKNKLNKILSDKDVNNGILFQPFCNTTITTDFTRKALKRVNALGTHFLSCNFSGVAATGSKFSDAEFANCNFSGANFQYCYFNNSHIHESSLIKGSNFSHSVFINCEFAGITIIESTFYDCYFENCTFSESNIRTDTFENSTMRHCSIKDINWAHLNLEYTQFEEVQMHNVVLPPYQIPYIIGIPSHLTETDEKIYVYTDSGYITIKEYCSMFTDLCAYFFGEKSYFPVANLLIAKGDNLEAFECIKQGIEEACDYFDFRMIKHYCRLACSNSRFSHMQLKELFDLVTNLSYSESWDINTLHSYMLNIGEIKEILLNNSGDQNRVEFVVKTNIDKDDLNSVNLLYNQVNALIKDACSNNHIDTIELRHNSPYELYITCIDWLPNILFFVSAMYSFFAFSNQGLEVFKNIEEITHIHHQNKLDKYEMEEKMLNLEIKKEELRKAKNQNNIVTASVYEVEHILKCSSLNIAEKITPEYLHYKIKNNPE